LNLLKFATTGADYLAMYGEGRKGRYWALSEPTVRKALRSFRYAFIHFIRQMITPPLRLRDRKEMFLDATKVFGM
jgi:hypothetical protein